MRDYENLTSRGAVSTHRAARPHGIARVPPVSGRSYCLRVHHPGYQSSDAIRSEFQSLESTACGADMVVLRPALIRGGEPRASAETDGVSSLRLVVLFDWIAGRFPKQPTLATVALSGVTLARLHEFARSFVSPSGFIRPVVYTDY